MKFRPKFVYGASTLLMTISSRPWTPSMLSIGGAGKSGAGVPEHYVLRREEKLGLRIRFYESEWDSVADFLAWCHDNSTAFTYYPDRDVAGESYSVYLESPLPNDEVQPERDPVYRRVFELPIVLRSTNGTRFTTTLW